MACTWDPANKGADVILTNGNLTANVTGLEEWVRATIGRSPAAGGVWQWEVSVPGGGAGGNDVRPGFGMVDSIANCANTNKDLGFDSHSWGFRTAPAGDGTPSFVFHNGNGGATWTGQIGGTAFIAGLVWDAVNRTLAIYQNGVLKYTLSSSSPNPTGAPVGTNGILMFPAFCSYSVAAPGGMSEHGTANFAGSFAFPIGGALPWGTPIPSGGMFAASP